MWQKFARLRDIIAGLKFWPATWWNATSETLSWGHPWTRLLYSSYMSIVFLHAGNYLSLTVDIPIKNPDHWEILEVVRNVRPHTSLLTSSIWNGPFPKIIGWKNLYFDTVASYVSKNRVDTLASPFFSGLSIRQMQKIYFLFGKENTFSIGRRSGSIFGHFAVNLWSFRAWWGNLPRKIGRRSDSYLDNIYRIQDAFYEPNVQNI